MHTKLIAMGTASGGHPLGARYFFIAKAAAVGCKQKEEEEIKCIAIGNTLCSDTRELLPLLSNEPYFFLYLVSFIAKGTSLSLFTVPCVYICTAVPHMWCANTGCLCRVGLDGSVSTVKLILKRKRGICNKYFLFKLLNSVFDTRDAIHSIIHSHGTSQQRWHPYLG